jgi:adenylylsulfate kinase-like enzyme
MTFKEKSNTAGLVWITGFSGAGKTTVAKLVVEHLKKQGVPTVFLDGDEIEVSWANALGIN